MAAVASLNDEREEVGKAAAANVIEGGIEGGGSGSGTGSKISMSSSSPLVVYELLESTFVKHSTPTILSSSGLCGLGMMLALVWMPLNGLLLLPLRKAMRVVHVCEINTAARRN